MLSNKSWFIRHFSIFIYRQMETLPAATRHSSRLPVVEVKPLKKPHSSSANRLLIVSPEVRAPCSELNTNTPTGSEHRTDITTTARLYQTREDNSQDSNNNQQRAGEQTKVKVGYSWHVFSSYIQYFMIISRILI